MDFSFQNSSRITSQDNSITTGINFFDQGATNSSLVDKMWNQSDQVTPETITTGSIETPRMYNSTEQDYFREPMNAEIGETESFNFFHGIQNAFMDMSSMATLGVGIGVSSGLQSLTNSYAQNKYYDALIGLGPEGHSFTAPNVAERQLELDKGINATAAAEIGIGSAFGPEGFIAGAIGAGITEAIGSQLNVNGETVNTTSGTTIQM